MEKYSRLLTGSFIMAEGVGEKSEQQLWDAGFHHWRDVVDAKLPLSPQRSESVKRSADACLERLSHNDLQWFYELLGPREQFRLLPWFTETTWCIDIETNGGFGPNDITIIGMHHRYETHILVKGKDMHSFPELFNAVGLMVTFFGTGFDIPFLKRAYPALNFDRPHVDVCTLMRRIDMKGGLKAIEHRLGISRDDDAVGLDGMDAVRLWNQWLYSRDTNALDLLIKYNREDIQNLPLLLDWAMPRLMTKIGADWLHQIE